MANDSSQAHYRAWLLTQPCACAPCVTKVEIHHHTSAPTFAPGEKPPKVIDAKRGKSQRSSDFYGIPLCPRHHTGELHRLKGFFAGWDHDQLRAWQDEQVRLHHERYDAWLERHPAQAPKSPAPRKPKASPASGDPLTAARAAGRLEGLAEAADITRDVMAQRHVNADQVAILDELRVQIEARGEQARRTG